MRVMVIVRSSFRNAMGWISSMVIVLLMSCIWAGCDSSMLAKAHGAKSSLAMNRATCMGGAYHHPRRLVLGASLPSLNGINFDPDGNLYVTSVIGRSIMRLDPFSGQILEYLGPSDGVEAPDDLTFGPDGSLYFTAFLKGEVGKISPDGVKTTVAQIGPGVNAITMSSNGRLFVSRVFIGDDLWEIDPAGTNSPRLIAENLGGFNGMDEGPDGYLYGPLWFSGQVARVNVDTGEVNVVADGFDTPAAVKFDHQGRLYVLDQHRAEVVRVDVASGQKTVVAYLTVGIDNLAFDSRDRLYVTNAHNGTVSLVLPGGLTRLLNRPGLTTPGGIAVQTVAGRKSIFVADIYTLREFSPYTGLPRSVAHCVVGGVTALNTPFSVAPYGENLVTTSWFANAVQVWDPMLQDVIEDHRDFEVPLNAIEFQGDLVVAELGSGSTGSVVKRPAGTQERIVLVSDLGVPTGLTAIDDKLFVANWTTGEILQLVDDGKLLDPPAAVATALAQPEGLAATPAGDLVVVEAQAKRLTKVHIDSGQTSTIAEDLPLGASGTPGYPPTWVFNSVAIDDYGVIYLSLA